MILLLVIIFRKNNLRDLKDKYYRGKRWQVPNKVPRLLGLLNL